MQQGWTELCRSPEFCYGAHTLPRTKLLLCQWTRSHLHHGHQDRGPGPRSHDDLAMSLAKAFWEGSLFLPGRWAAGQSRVAQVRVSGGQSQPKAPRLPLPSEVTPDWEPTVHPSAGCAQGDARTGSRGSPGVGTLEGQPQKGCMAGQAGITYTVITAPSSVAGETEPRFTPAAHGTVGLRQGASRDSLCAGARPCSQAALGPAEVQIPACHLLPRLPSEGLAELFVPVARDKGLRYLGSNEQRASSCTWPPLSLLLEAQNQPKSESSKGFLWS